MTSPQLPMRICLSYRVMTAGPQDAVQNNEFLAFTRSTPVQADLEERVTWVGSWTTISLPIQGVYARQASGMLAYPKLVYDVLHGCSLLKCKLLVVQQHNQCWKSGRFTLIQSSPVVAHIPSSFT